jgi:hypothetical protein
LHNGSVTKAFFWKRNTVGGVMSYSVATFDGGHPLSGKRTAEGIQRSADAVRACWRNWRAARALAALPIVSPDASIQELGIGAAKPASAKARTNTKNSFMAISVPVIAKSHGLTWVFEPQIVPRPRSS